MVHRLHHVRRLTRSFGGSASYAPFSSASKAAPRFPVPNYVGESRPTPVSAVAPLTNNASDERQREISDALRPSYHSQTPLLLQNLLDGCDAMYFWRSLEYWRAAVGDMPVEIEVGKSYNSGKRVPIAFGDYLDYLALSTEQENKELESMQAGKEVEKSEYYGEQDVAYLAQNELFPQVMGDITVPSFCEKEGYAVGEGKLYHTMLWMGPRSTVSPLHFDPLDNLLMQVVGWKRVLLFPADEQSHDETKSQRSGGSDDPWWHYAGEDYNQKNTSAVDVETPDYIRFPHFRSAPVPYECILGPGDALYIPSKWWHHVRSLEFSVSANIWWR